MFRYCCMQMKDRLAHIRCKTAYSHLKRVTIHTRSLALGILSLKVKKNEKSVELGRIFPFRKLLKLHMFSQITLDELFC